MTFPVTMEDVCQITSSVITMTTVETTVMKRTVVCMWCEIWFNDPAPFMKRLLVIRASVDALCRDEQGQISRDPRTKSF